MEKTKTIKLKNLGIVSIEMDPKNPKTKFDKKLKNVIPAGEIYQLAMFNDSNTKFRLIEDIAKNKQDVYEINKNTYYHKLNKDVEIVLYRHKCYVFKPNIKYQDGLMTCLFEGAERTTLHNDEHCFSLNSLLDNNKTFVSSQIKMKQYLIDKKESCNVLDANF